MKSGTSRAVPDISRRTLTKGAAWSLPVVAIAAAAPAAAASSPPVASVSGVQDQSGGDPAGDEWPVTLTFVASGAAATIQVQDITTGGVSILDPINDPGPWPATVPGTLVLSAGIVPLDQYNPFELTYTDADGTSHTAPLIITATGTIEDVPQQRSSRLPASRIRVRRLR